MESCFAKTECNHALVVDDESPIVLILEMGLKEAGYKVTTAFSGDEALEIIRQDATIDFIISDRRMPGNYDGLQLFEEVKKLFPQKPFFLLTGCTEIRDQDAHALGLSGLFHKPFEVKAILKQLEEVCKGRAKK